MRQFTTFLTVLTFLGASTLAYAQMQGSSGSRSGSSGSRSSGGSSRTSGGSSRSSGGSFGNSNFGSNMQGFGLGATQMGTSVFGGDLSPLGVGQNTPLSRQNASGTQGGRTSSRNRSSRNTGGQFNFGGQSGGGSRGQNFGGMNQFGSGMTMTQPAIRPVVTVGITPPPVRSETIGQAAASVFGSKVLPTASNVKTSFSNGVVTLTGTVGSSRDAQLAAAIISLEPGVRSVENRLVVAPSAPQ